VNHAYPANDESKGKTYGGNGESRTCPRPERNDHGAETDEERRSSRNSEQDSRALQKGGHPVMPSAQDQSVVQGAKQFPLKCPIYGLKLGSISAGVEVNAT